MQLSLLLLSLTAPASAHPGGHDDMHSRPRPLAPPAPPAAVIPADFAGTVAAMKERATAAGTALDGMKIIDVHHAARALTELSAALLPKTSSLSAEGKAAAATSIPVLEAQIAALIVAADKGNATNGKAALTTLQTELDKLAALK